MIAQTIGSIAHQHLLDDQDAAVLGTNRRGVYLKLNSGWVVFLSKETCHGPLTVNVAGEHKELDNLRSAASARITQDGIYFSAAGLLLRTKHARVWQLPARPQYILSPSQRLTRLETVFQSVACRKTSASLAALQALLAGIEHETGPKTGQLVQLLHQLQYSLVEGEAKIFGETLKSLLGYGPGLTPTGDDIIAGMLLALSRWGDKIAPDLDLPAITRFIQPLAYHKTATLSANIIECATQGQADERLVYALDGLVSGVPDAQTCARYLVDWGNTSGIDSLVGMAITMLTQIHA